MLACRCTKTHGIRKLCLPPVAYRGVLRMYRSQPSPPSPSSVEGGSQTQNNIKLTMVYMLPTKLLLY